MDDDFRRMIGTFSAYKKNPFHVVAIAQHTEANEQFAVYAPVNQALEGGDFYLRKIEDFLDDAQCRNFPLPNLETSDFVNARWEHFKSTAEKPMTYTTQGIAVLEHNDSIERFILYTPEYAAGQNLMEEQKVTCLARPFDMFTGDITRGDYSGPRFRRLSE